MAVGKMIHKPPIVSGIIYLLIGVGLSIAGARLLAFGDTLYYLLAGIAFAVTGILLIRAKHSALYLYAAFLIYTFFWALYEVGLDGWKLLPRLDIVIVLGFYLLMPWVRRGLKNSQGVNLPALSGPLRALSTLLFIGLLSGTVLFIFIPPAAQTDEQAIKQIEQKTSDQAVGGEDNSQWHSWGGTHANNRYAPFDQITPDNVKNLEVAWVHRTGDIPTKEEQKSHGFAFEATPIKVDNTLFFCTPRGRIQSVNATTGKQNWHFDPKADLHANYFWNCRGVSYWQADPVSDYKAPDGSKDCIRRIIGPVLDGRIVAIDAETGKLCPSFGDNGFINMKTGLGHVPAGIYSPTSAPLVANNLIVAGALISDGTSADEPSGVVRAWDVKSGKLVWSWDLGRNDPNLPLKPGEMYTRATPNAWAPFSADVKNGLVYVPTGNATPDFYGPIRRPIDNEYNSSLVALDLTTGKMRWKYQFVHRDVWDLDTPTGPSLIDMKDAEGQLQPALIQTTKRGAIFILNRLTGKPMFPVKEEPVHRTGEQAGWLSPTQPYVEGFPQMEPAKLKTTDIWGATMFDQLWCRLDIHRHDYTGPFTAPSERGALGMPSADGITDWFGSSIDMKRQIMIAPASHLGFIYTLIPRQKAIKEGLVKDVKDWRNHPEPALDGAITTAYGSPYAEKNYVIWASPLGIPCNAPPWGSLQAMDLNSHKVLWNRYLGNSYGTGPFGLRMPIPMQTGIVTMGGGVATRSGLFIVAGTIDQYFRVFETRTGKLLYEKRLPAGAQATPTVYMGNDGREYIALAVGGHSHLLSKNGDYLYAFALPVK